MNLPRSTQVGSLEWPIAYQLGPGEYLVVSCSKVSSADASSSSCRSHRGQLRSTSHRCALPLYTPDKKRSYGLSNRSAALANRGSRIANSRGILGSQNLYSSAWSPSRRSHTEHWNWAVVGRLSQSASPTSCISDISPCSCYVTRSDTQCKKCGRNESRSLESFRPHWRGRHRSNKNPTPWFCSRPKAFPSTLSSFSCPVLAYIILDEHSSCPGGFTCLCLMLCQSDSASVPPPGLMMKPFTSNLLGPFRNLKIIRN